MFVSIKLAAIRWSKKAGFQFPSVFFPLIFSTIEAMPAPLSSANILQEPPKEAGCAIAAPDRSLRSAGATRTDAGGLQENKENFSCCETRDLEKQRLSLHRIAVQGEHAPNSRAGDVNHFLSRGEDKMYKWLSNEMCRKTVQSTLSQKTDPIANPPLLTSLDSKENNEMESVLYSVYGDDRFPPP